MLPLGPIYAWQYGLGTKAVVTTLHGLIQMALAQHPQQTRHPEMALAHQQKVALVQKHNSLEVAMMPSIPPVASQKIRHREAHRTLADD